jgi:hypothetical protein
LGSRVWGLGFGIYDLGFVTDESKDQESGEMLSTATLPRIQGLGFRCGELVPMRAKTTNVKMLKAAT